MDSNNYEQHHRNSDTDYKMKCCSWQESFFYDFEIIFRISSPENIIVNSILFINDEIIDNFEKPYDKYIDYDKILKD